MSDITVVLPFSLPPAELAPDLLRALTLPSLAMLLARAEPARSAVGKAGGARDENSAVADGFARALPHETWLARRFGLDEKGDRSSPAIAAMLMAAQKSASAPADGYWFVVSPVHFHVARDHLVLTDTRSLALSENDAMDLFTAALPAFEEAGLMLRFGSAGSWFVRADAWRDMVTATADAACGHNIDIWMPQGPSARAWRKLQNSVQMDWHAHPVNAARSNAGQQPVNSLWLWGGAQALPPPSRVPVAMAGFQGWFAGFTALASSVVDAPDLAPLLVATEPHRLLLRAELIGPALAGDWAEWLDRVRELEITLFAPLLAALRTGQIERLQIILGHATELQAWSVTRASLRRFWRTPSLTRLRSASSSPANAA